MDDRQIIEDFVVESREHLADIENQLLAIEASGENIDGDLVNTVLRAVHSIKGAAGFFHFSVVQELAHELENVLNLVRNRQLVPNASMTDVLLRAADTLRSMIENIDHSNEVDVSRHLAELRAVVAGEPAGGPLPWRWDWRSTKRSSQRGHLARREIESILYGKQWHTRFSSSNPATLLNDL